MSYVNKMDSVHQIDFLERSWEELTPKLEDIRIEEVVYTHSSFSVESFFMKMQLSTLFLR